MSEARLVDIIRRSPRLMSVLKTARDLDLPDWMIFSGGVYQTAWNALTGRDPDYGIKDYDVAYHDASDTSYEAEGYPANARRWAEANGCEREPTDTDLTDSVIHRTWDCPADGPVEFDLVVDGGHTWPGTQFSVSLESIMGATDQTVDANELIWAFFQRFALPPA